MTVQEMIEQTFGEGSHKEMLDELKEMQKCSNINIFNLKHLSTGAYFACQLKTEHPERTLISCTREGFGMAAIVIYQGGEELCN